LNSETVSEVLEELRVYEQRLNSEGVPFTEQKLPGVADLDEIEERLNASAGAAPDDLIAWFHWQGGLLPGPGFGRATVYGGFVPLGLSDSIEETSEFRWAPYNYPTTTSGPNPWVLLAVQRPGSTMLISNVFSGEIHTVFTHGGDSNHMANSVSDMVRLWTDLWAVAFKWDPEMGVGLKVPGKEVPPELRARSGYVM
jgi:hypothetical protein